MRRKIKVFTQILKSLHYSLKSTIPLKQEQNKWSKEVSK